MTFETFDEYWDSPIHCDKYPTEIQRRVAKHAWDTAIASAKQAAENEYSNNESQDSMQLRIVDSIKQLAE